MASQESGCAGRGPIVPWILVPLTLLALALTAPAQESPDELTRAEWHCEQETARAASQYADRVARCLEECRLAAPTDPSRSCRESMPDQTTGFCLGRAAALAEARVLPICAGAACPECYAPYGTCGWVLRSHIWNAGDAQGDFEAQVGCEDPFVANLNTQESACANRLRREANRFQRQAQRCFNQCNQGRQLGIATDLECGFEYVGTPSGNRKLEICIDLARARLGRACVSCRDEPSCWASTFGANVCSNIVRTVENSVFYAESELYCMDEPICGDGIVAGDEQCEPWGYPTPCPAGYRCGGTCACEPIPAICGDGLVSVLEDCDWRAWPNGCAAGTECGSGCSCAEAAGMCAAPPTIPPEGGTLQVQPLGNRGTVFGTCGGRGPEAVLSWTPAEGGRWTIDTCGNSRDTVLHIRTGGCAGQSAEIACNDDSSGCAGGGARLQIPVLAGREYFVFADTFSYGSVTAPFLLRVAPVPGDYGSPGRAFVPGPPMTLLE